MLFRSVEGDDAALRALFAEPGELVPWLERWRHRYASDGAAGPLAAGQRAARMRRASPWIIPRNHRVEEALAAANDGNLVPFERLLAALRRPFDAAKELAAYAEPAPREMTAGYRTFCGT